MKPISCLQYVDGKLFCEDIPVSKIADQFGTPCYLYSKKAVSRNMDTLLAAFPPEYADICYAVKANSTLSILELISSRGLGFDIVSAGELYRLRRIGVSGSRIIFSGVGKTIDEIDWAIKAHIFSLGVESLEELAMIGERAEAARCSVVVSLRLNLDIEADTHPGISTGTRKHKFGLDVDLLPKALEIIRANPLLRLKGIGSHIGSQIMDPEPYIKSFRALLETAEGLEQSGFPLEFLDIGGGFGIPYDDQSEPFRLDRLSRFLAENRGPYRIVLEPGRFIVGPAGSLLSKVILTKTTGGRKFIVIDAGMNDMMRPALYQSRHRILPETEPAGRLIKADLVGPICESTDRFAEDIELPPLDDGSLVALADSGAYGSVLASNYNSRGRPPEIKVDGSRATLIRKRETWEDLTSLE